MGNGLYGFTGNATSVPITSTAGLYQQSGSTVSVLNNAQTLYNLLANSSSIGFYLTNNNLDVAATTLATGVTAGTYGNLLYYPIITVGLDGRVTSASIVPTATSGYGNANVAAYLTGAVTIGNLTVTSGVFWPNGQPYGNGTVYGNANVAAYLPTYAGTLNNSSTIIGINANIAGANASIATINANIGSFYTYANATYSTQANAASQESEISSLRSNITAANTAIAATNANIGSFYTYANATYSTIANAAIQEGEISSLRSNITAANAAIAATNANIGSFYTYANVTYQTIAGAYGNSNVASYLPSYGNNIGSLATNGTITVIQTFTSGSVWTAPIDIVSANILLVGGGGSGGSSNYALAPAGGGGAGGVLWTGNLANITPGQQFTITIGSGGATPAAGNVNGNTGNNTTVTWPGSSYTAYGGGYGAGGSVNNFGGNGAGGGGGSIYGTSGTSGGYAIYGTQGTKGEAGVYTSFNLMVAGYGGGAGAPASPGAGITYADPIYLTNSGSSVAYAGGGYPGATQIGTPILNPGNQGVGYGGGGGGGATVPGTAGTQGVVIISYQVPNYLMNAYSNNIVANAVTITNLQVLNSITADRVSTTNGYFWSNGTSYASTVNNYGNSNVAVYLASNTDATISSLTANTQQQQAQINSINANVTAVNVAIASTNANLASFETYANATFGTSNYGNANVAAYLPTYSGNISAGNLNVSGITVSGNVRTLANVTAGNVVSTNGFFWSNGTPYSTGGGVTSITAGTGITANASTGAISLTNSGVTAIVAGTGITANTSTGVVSISASGGGGSFTGNLAGNPLYDGANYRVNVNAYPLSSPTILAPGQLAYGYLVNTPVYIGGVLQAPAALGFSTSPINNGIVYGELVSSNIALQSSYQTSTLRVATGQANYNQVWPTTANNMTSSDRLYAGAQLTDVMLTNGVKWPSTTASYSIPNIVGFLSQTDAVGNGTIGTIAGIRSVIATIPTSGNQANVTYAINYFASLQPNSGVATSATFSSNVTNWYGYTGSLSGSLSQYNNIGTAAMFYVANNWAGANSKYAFLNQDSSSTVQSQSGFTVASGSGSGITFQDGTTQTTAAGASLNWAGNDESSGNFTAIAGQGYLVNTQAGGPTTVTLPASPSQGQIVGFADNVGNFAANSLTIYGNGAKIMLTSSGNLTLTNNWEGLQMVYDNGFNGWIPIAGINNGTLSPPANTYSASYLIVGGGGGSSCSDGGGGGAGGYLAGSTYLTTGTTYSFTVGAGGAGTGNNLNPGGNGGNSTFTGLTTAVGGGGGGGGGSPSGISGGSGGGAGNGGVGGSSGSGTAGQGYAGGSAASDSTNYCAAGGGGAQALGSNAVPGSTGGNGGVGIANSITGSSVYYAGGGGGASLGGAGVGTGGLGGGGNGSSSTGNAGSANTGGGAGGAGPGGVAGANGGSGVVIVSVPTANYTGTTTGSPTVTTSGGNTIMTFTSSGSYTA